MRKIIITEFISLDGVFEAPGPDGSSFQHQGWTMPYANEEFMKFKAEELFSADALLLGRTTYEGFAKAWPKVTDAGEFGERMNSMEKYVVSTTLPDADWNNSKIISNNVVEEVSKLKEQPGKDILVCGSGILSKTLLENKLVDEINLLVYPVTLGSGKKFFQEGNKMEFTFGEARPFKTGVVLLRYHK